MMIRLWFERLYKNKSIRIKLLINYVVTVLLIVVILSLLNAKNLLFEVEGLLDRNTSQLLGQTRNSVEFYIRDLENIVYYISEDQNIADYIRSEGDADRESVRQKLLETLETYTTSHEQINGLLVAFADDTFISNDMVAISREPISEDEWYEKAIDNPNDIHLFAKPINRNVKSLYDYYSSDNLVSIVKAVTPEGYEEPVGVVLIDLKIDGIGDTIAIESEESEFFYMADDQLDIVYAPVNKTVYRVNRKMVGMADDNAFEQLIGNRSYKIIYEYSSYLNCYFIGVFSLGPLYAIVQAIQNDMIIYALILLLIGVVITALLTNTIIKPLGKLQRLMKHVEQGEFDIRFDVKSNDEIGQLGSGFNQMTYSINNLIQMVEIEQKKKKEAELKAFQAQIKPHFLYNTLDTINWMAQEYEADDISDIVCNLTNLFRLSLSRGKEVIPLRDELDQVESYLNIQMVRYKDKFRYVIDCPKALYSCQVAKLILQPLVENAIYHGIKGNDRLGEISITARSEEEDLWLTVRDNGKGISDIALSKINHILRYRDMDTKDIGIGIININERIKLIYGSEYGVEMFHAKGAGTEVRIHLPLNKTV